MAEAPLVANDDSPTSPLSSRLERVLEAVRRAFGRRRSSPDTAVEAPTAGYRKRPPGWGGHWSERYARLLARTLDLVPPIRQTQSELLRVIPRPLQETFDPVASSGELTDRDGNLVSWSPGRSALSDLFG